MVRKIKINYTRPKLYKKQAEFVNCSDRYVVVEASTKAGKTVALIAWLFEQALQGKNGDNFWWVAPTFTTSKIAFRRMKRFINPKSIYTANNTEYTIRLRNGATIWFKSGDNPDNLYGDDVKAVVIDEATRCKKEVWTAVRSVVTQTGGKVRLIGNVKGKNNWVYTVAREAEAGKERWSYFRLTALDAVEGGVFSREEFEDAKDSLSEEDFNELYMAVAYDKTEKPWVHSFDEKLHVDNEPYKIKQHLPVYISFDFNVDPITCTFHQYEIGVWARTFKEIALENSDIFALCDQIKVELDIDNLDIRVNGDASGSSRNAAFEGRKNYFLIIQKELNLPSRCFNVPTKNPHHRDSKVLTNALFSRHPDFKICACCKKTIDDIKYIQSDDEGGIVKDRTKKKDDIFNGADLLDTVRYFHYANFSQFITKHLQ